MDAAHASALDPHIAILPLAALVRDDTQVRRTPSPASAASLDELAESIRQYGVLQPLVVRRHPLSEDRYVVIAGGRRLAAATRAGLETVPALVRDAQGTTVYILQLTENLQRRDLDTMDEARAYQLIMDAEAISSEALAKRVNRSPQHIRDRLRVYNNATLADAVRERQISTTVAREIDKLADEARDALVWRVAQGERVTTEDVEQVRVALLEAGLVNPRNTRPPVATGTDTAAAPGTPAPPPARPAPVYRLAEEVDEVSPAHPPTEPRRAIPRPSPYDGVRVRGAEETRNVYSVDPAHLIVEAPPSRYGRIPVRDDEAAGAARRAEATAPPVLPAPEARDRAQPTLNRVEGEADATPRLTAALARLDREALYTVLDYGIERGWSCAGLRSYIIALAR